MELGRLRQRWLWRGRANTSSISRPLCLHVIQAGWRDRLPAIRADIPDRGHQLIAECVLCRGKTDSTDPDWSYHRKIFHSDTLPDRKGRQRILCEKGSQCLHRLLRVVVPYFGLGCHAYNEQWVVCQGRKDADG